MDTKEIERRFSIVSDEISKTNTRLNEVIREQNKVKDALTSFYDAVANIFGVKESGK